MRKRVISYALMCSICATLTFSTIGTVHATSQDEDVSIEKSNGDGDFIMDSGDDDFVSDNSGDDDFIMDDSNDDFISDDVEIPLDNSDNLGNGGTEDEFVSDVDFNIDDEVGEDKNNTTYSNGISTNKENTIYTDSKRNSFKSKSKGVTKSGKVSNNKLSKTGSTDIIQELKNSIDAAIYSAVKFIVG